MLGESYVLATLLVAVGVGFVLGMLFGMDFVKRKVASGSYEVSK